jgi:GT2 family glycosyltransferase
MQPWAVSVVIPTHNRRERLTRVLSALEQQATPLIDMQVVVVDDGSTDDTSAWLAQAQFPFEMISIRQANAGPAAARNAGILAAEKEFILFLDDDVVPEPDLVHQHAKVHLEATRDLVVLGTMASLPHYSQPWVDWEQVQLEKQYRAMERGEFAPTFRQFWTGNASVRRSRLIEAGLFNVALRRGEDVDLGRRLQGLGLEYVFNPKARGLHHAERTLASFCKAHSAYGEMEVALFHSEPKGVEYTLAGNWHRLHPAQRRMLGVLLSTPPGSALARAGLAALLGSPLGSALPSKFRRAACSILANLLFWEASRRTLGADRFEYVTTHRPNATF